MPVAAAVAPVIASSAGIGSALGSIGQAVGIGSSIAGMFGGGQKRPRMLDSVKGLLGTHLRSQIRDFRRPGSIISWSDAQGIHEGNMMRYRMEAAKSLGIHPLAMLGMPTSGSPSMPFSSPEGSKLDSFAAGGADLSRALSAGMTTTEKLQERLLLAQIQGQEIDNATRASILAKSQQPGNPPAGSTLNDRLMSMVHNRLGVADGVMPISRVGVDDEGVPMRVYNDELGDNEVLMGVHALRYTFPDWIQGHVTRPAGRWLRDVFRVRRPYSK